MISDKVNILVIIPSRIQISVTGTNSDLILNVTPSDGGSWILYLT